MNTFFFAPFFFSLVFSVGVEKRKRRAKQTRGKGLSRDGEERSGEELGSKEENPRKATKPWGGRESRRRQVLLVVSELDAYPDTSTCSTQVIDVTLFYKR